jgi:hypothetical protein
MRTTSSWQPRSTAYSLARPWGERVLLVLRLAPTFSVPSAFFDVQQTEARDAIAPVSRFRYEIATDA